MHIGLRIGAAVVGTAGLVGVLAACSTRRDDGTTKARPMSDLTLSLMDQLKPGVSRAARPALDVQRDAIRRETNGAMDGTRLLQAADAHAYGTPAAADPARDVRGDGTATFEELRHVVASFDADGSGRLDNTEVRTFEQTVGLRWLPG